jgi:hypothetical protein
MATSKPLHLGGRTVVCVDDHLEGEGDVWSNSSRSTASESPRGRPTLIIRAVSGEQIALICLADIRETADLVRALRAAGLRTVDIVAVFECFRIPIVPTFYELALGCESRGTRMV